MTKSVLIISERGITASNLLFGISQRIQEFNLNLDVDYAPYGNLADKMSKKKYDLLLVTPQAARHESETAAIIKNCATSAKVVTIGDDDFHFMNIPHILKVVLTALGEKNPFS